MVYTPNVSFLKRVEDYIGDVVTDYNENGLKDVFDATLREMISILPPELLYARGSYSTANGNKFEITDGNGTSMAGKVFVRVYRENGSVNKLCEMVDLDAWFSASDSNSIYAASAVSPICTIDEGDSLQILPAPDGTDEARLYAFNASYHESNPEPVAIGSVGYDIDTDTDTSYGLGLYARTIKGLPVEANEALILKVCLNYLTAYLGEAVQEDEDVEIVNLINAQSQALQAKFGQEMARLGVNPNEPVEV